MNVQGSFFETKIEFLKGVGPKRAALLNTELNIFTFGDFLEHYPFRHEDRSVFYRVAQLSENLPYVQVVGRIMHLEEVGEGAKHRLVAYLQDNSGVLELVWFQGIKWIKEKVKKGLDYVVFGKPTFFNGKYSISHPDIEPLSEANQQGKGLEPVYSTTQKLSNQGLDSRGIGKLQKQLIALAYEKIPETLPDYVINRYGLVAKKTAVANIHFPRDVDLLAKARLRLKFEELFFIQLKLLFQKQRRTEKSAGQVFNKILVMKTFYDQHLPFVLTNAQKRVIREIYNDMKSGKQMNRLLQGDVGSGKTIVAFICMLIAYDNAAQSCLMAPTEILAEQHYRTLLPYAEKLGVSIDLLTGSTKASDRKRIHERLQNQELSILIGTHALLEDNVTFKNLGLCIIDEQHRFGVAQRARLWTKNPHVLPHILVMTATPIPRTLAMTLYGDLDVSVIDELPAGRKPIKTLHFYESQRLRAFGLLRQELLKGRQAYVVYPLIEESEKLDYKNLMEGYEAISRAFPDMPLSIVHGKMRSQDKDYEMQRFVKGETKIMVATTVIEVGVNVPNATVMLIENAERFGLSQLHQLRGRVGRGAEQSYCILMTDLKISKESKIRLD
ncbi:MAG: ATP-dependent DNA helicase RecG, partial [Flammeovirgaceae bacterium]|nr:ATP-dependent DNA helicase RecG [Flammeovirgaceae bacterium]MDW8287343.1 ATP-dependent DNA helicase RecG [Flammeovirgaceae bacterium]